jgi:hypothetical protein
VAKLFAGAQVAAEAGIVCSAEPGGNPDGAGPIAEDAPAAVSAANGRVQRRLVRAPGSRRRLARSSLLAGFRAMAETWAGGDSSA